MKLLFIRHAEPDYVHDSLTEKGFYEAKLLADKLEKTRIDHYYVSPLGRARETARITLERKGATAEECIWLREFDPKINRPDVTDKKKIAWDWLPQDWCTYDDFYSYDNWMNHPAFKDSKVYEEYKMVTESFDKLLSRHGYERCGKLYKATASNDDTIALFCHFGVASVLLSHLFSISPMVMWHNSCALPSAVTTLVTEERREGTAAFRMLSFGNLEHLYVQAEEPSFAARFCECYKNENERHD